MSARVVDWRVRSPSGLKRPRVYVAGPYSKGDVAVNVRKAILAGSDLWYHGFAPFVPHLTHFWHLLAPMPYESWLELDDHFLSVCDAMLRLPGESSGADEEVQFALDLGIPVFYSVGELVKALNGSENENENERRKSNEPRCDGCVGGHV